MAWNFSGFTSDQMATVAAIASALAAFGSVAVSCSQSKLPFEAALYQARWQSAADFSFAMSQFYDRYDRVRIDMPDWLGDQSAYAGKSDEDLMAAAREAQPILIAIGDLSAQVSKAATPWSKETIIKISAALSEAERITDCFQKFATFTSRDKAPADWWATLRRNLPSECNGSLGNTNVAKLKELGQVASQVMVVEAQKRVDFGDLDELATGKTTM